MIYQVKLGFKIVLNMIVAILQDRSIDGPLPWSTANSVSFIAEQVSHHPPSMYACVDATVNMLAACTNECQR